MDPSDAQLREARETMEILFEISKILNTGLDRETLGVCVALCESGANPEALAAVVKELRREAAASTQQTDVANSRQPSQR